MKQILFTLSFAILSLVAASCKKSDDIDPRDQYVGDYDITSTYYNPAGSGSLGSVKSNSRTDNGKIIISKSSKANVLLISSDQATMVYMANLKEDAVFVLEPVYSTETYTNNTTYQLTRTGDGRFINSSLKLVLTITAPALGLNQTVNVVGNKR